jgi:HAD superfamily hydrolase (TIGR01509 family)
MKPSVDAFRAVAAKAGIDPARSLFVDDVAANVDGAREAGFAGHVFTTRASFERFLSDPSGS